MTLIANARMYAVSPEAAAAWSALFRRVIALSGVEMEIIPHAFPLPVSDLWLRPDLGCAFMCGWPWVRGFADVVPLAAPVTVEAGRPVYWSNLVVAADSPARTLADTAGGRVAYTIKDSQSGFSALRHHLRLHGPAYAGEVGPLTTPRRMIEAVAEGRADIGPVDSFAHALLRRYAPELTARVRVIAQTAPTPIPLLVASRGVPVETASRLRAALLDLTGDQVLEPLEITGFIHPLPREQYGVMEHWAQEAEAAGVHSLAPAACAS